MEKRSTGSELIISMAIAFLFFWFGWKSAGKEKEPGIVATDTVFIVRIDTTFIEKPTEIVRYVCRTDTVRLVAIDTNGNLKPTETIVPIECAIYQDSTENAKYTAYLSGFQPHLDSIAINCKQTETIITKIEREQARRIGFGVQFGVGISAQGIAAPYLGVGVQYRIF